MPVTSEVNLELLIKLLKLSNSPNDGEALMAARKANQQIEKVGGDWDTLLRGKVKIIADPFGSQTIDAQPANTGWSPRTSTPTPPPPPRPSRYSKPSPAYQQAQKPTPPPANFPEPPRDYTRYDYTQAVWDGIAGFYTTQPRAIGAASTQPQQTAIVNYASWNSEWILNSNEKLTRYDSVLVIRRDGKTKRERVGKFVEEKNGRFYYNIEGKTNAVGAGSLSV